MTPPDSLTLAHNGAEWQGTYGVVLRALLDDLLGDGPDTPVTIAVTRERSDGALTLHRGPLLGRSETALQLTDGTVIDLETVLAVEVL